MNINLCEKGFVCLYKLDIFVVCFVGFSGLLNPPIIEGNGASCIDGVMAYFGEMGLSSCVFLEFKLRR